MSRRTSRSIVGALLLMAAVTPATLANDGVPGTVPELVDPNPGTAQGADPVPTLEGTEWLLVKAQLSGAFADIPAGVDATLTMTDGQAGGSGGCNQWTAAYQLDGQSLIFGQPASTLMLCTGPGGEIETFFLADLGAVTSWAIEGTTLTLSGDTGPVLQFTPRAASGPSVEGDWIIAEYNDGRGALVAIADRSATITIADGQVTGTVGCNGFFGPIAQDGETLSVGMIGSTEMYCEGLMERETAVIESLGASTMVRSEADGLVFLDAAGTVQLHLVPSGTTPSSPVPSPAA